MCSTNSVNSTARSGVHRNASIETPAIEVHLIEQYIGQSSTDARGVAEPANVARALAIANACFTATGKRIRGQLNIWEKKTLQLVAGEGFEPSTFGL
jgi:hypothetical protein